MTISYPSRDGERELPFRLLVVADLAGGPRPAAIAERNPVAVLPRGIDAAMALVAPRLRGRIDDHLAGGPGLDLDLHPTALADVAPAALMAQVPELAAAVAARDAVAQARYAPDAAPAPVRAVLAALGRDGTAGDADLALAVAELDRRIAAQLDAILHWPPLRRLEAAWRSLALLASACAGLEGVRLHAVAATRDEVEADLEDAPVPTAAGLHRLVYGEYGQFGGEPWAALVTDLELGPGRRDLALLRRLAAVAAAAHAPLLAAAAPELLGLSGWQRLPPAADVPAAMATPALAAWLAFRQGEDARHVVLAAPRVLLRQPWGADGRGHREDVAAGHDRHLWGSAAFALAGRLAAGFAVDGWCSRIAGAAALPADPHGRIQVETALGEELAAALAEAGLTPLIARRGSSDAWFPLVRTARLPGRDGHLAVGLEGVMLLDRIAHHVKALGRERVGSWGDRGGIERGLADWLGGLVVDMDDPTPELLARRPLRQAAIRVHEVPGSAGWYRAELEAAPHPAWLGARCTLSLVARLERSA